MIQVLEKKMDHEKQLNPCQLKKIWGTGIMACSFDCAFDHDCPVYYANAKGEPILSCIRDQKLIKNPVEW